MNLEALNLPTASLVFKHRKQAVFFVLTEELAGVGFANYVVGNEVQNFWKTEMGGKKNGKMTDPFSFMVKKGKKAQTEAAADASDDDSAAEVCVYVYANEEAMLSDAPDDDFSE